MGLPDSYFEQQPEVDKPSLKVNWIGFFNHFACQFLWVCLCSLWKQKRGFDITQKPTQQTGDKKKREYRDYFEKKRSGDQRFF